MDKKEDEEEGESSPTSPTLHTLKTLERTWTGSSNGSIQQWIDSLNEGDWHELNEGQSTSPQEIETVTYSNIHFLPVPCSTEDELHLGADARSISYEGSERGFSMSPLLDDKLELPLTTDKSKGHIINDDTAGIDEQIYEQKIESKQGAQDLEKPMAHVKNEWMYENRQNSFSSINSVSSLLAATEMDPEDMLVSLGFGEEFSTPYHRIPARFFMNPSQANGIDVDDFCSKFLDADHLKASGLENTRMNVLGSRFNRSSIDLSWVNSDDKLLAKMRRLKFRQSSVPSITVNDDYEDRDGSSSDKASATRVPGNLRLSTVEEEYEPSSRKSSFSRSFSKEKAKLSKQERFEVDIKETAFASANGLNEERLPGKDHKHFTSVESNDNVFERKESTDANCVNGKCKQMNGSKQETETVLPDRSKQCNGLGAGVEIRNEFCEGEAEKAEKIGENSNTQGCKKISSVSSFKNILDGDLEDQEDLFRWDRNNNTSLNGLDKAKFESTPKKFSEPMGYEKHNGIVTRKHIFDDEEKVYLQDDIFTERSPSSGEKIRGDSKEDKATLEVYDEEKRKPEDDLDRVDPSEFSTISDYSYHDSIEDSMEDKFQAIEVPLEEENNFSDDSLEESTNDDNISAHSEYETDSIENKEQREDHLKEVDGIEPHTPSRVVYRSLGKVENLITPEHGDSRETESSHQRGFGESLKLHGGAIIENIPFISKRRTVSVESAVVETVSTGDEPLSLGETSQCSTKKPSRLRNYLRKLASGRIRSFMSLESLNNTNLLNGGRMCKSHENLICEEKSPSTQSLSQSCLEDHVDRNETYRSRRSEKLRNLTKQEVSREELLNSELNSLSSKTVCHPSQRTFGEVNRRNGVNQSQTENSLEDHCSYLATKKGGYSYTNGNADNKARGEKMSRGRAKGLSKGFSVESSGFEDENDVSKSAAVREYNDCKGKHACLDCMENTMGSALLGAVSGTSASPKSGPRSSTPTDSLVSVVDANQFEYLVGQMSSLRKEVREQEDRVKAYIEESMERIRSSFLTEMSIINASLKTRSTDNSLNGDING